MQHPFFSPSISTGLVKLALVLLPGVVWGQEINVLQTTQEQSQTIGGVEMAQPQEQNPAQSQAAGPQQGQSQSQGQTQGQIPPQGEALIQGQSFVHTQEQSLVLTERDRAIAQLWGITDDEMLRAKFLQLGPRAAFSVPGISPLEILGIHARNDAERQKYAMLFARVQYEDVKRVLAFQRAYDEQIRTLVGAQPMFDYTGLPKVNASNSAADLMHVPRSQLIQNNSGANASNGGAP